MERIWKFGFLGLLVLAGTGLVMAGLGGEAPVDDSISDCTGTACELPDLVVEEVEEPLCGGGCGKIDATCGSDCGCGCQKEAACPGGCGLSSCGGSCTRAPTGCGCR